MTTILSDEKRRGIDAGGDAHEPEASEAPGMDELQEADAFGGEWEMPAIGDYESLDVPPVQ